MRINYKKNDIVMIGEEPHVLRAILLDDPDGSWANVVEVNANNQDIRQWIPDTPVRTIYLGRGVKNLTAFPPADEPQRPAELEDDLEVSEAPSGLDALFMGDYAEIWTENNQWRVAIIDCSGDATEVDSDDAPWNAGAMARYIAHAVNVYARLKREERI